MCQPTATPAARAFLPTAPRATSARCKSAGGGDHPHWRSDSAGVKSGADTHAKSRWPNSLDSPMHQRRRQSGQGMPGCLPLRHRRRVTVMDEAINGRSSDPVSALSSAGTQRNHTTLTVALSEEAPQVLLAALRFATGKRIHLEQWPAARLELALNQRQRQVEPHHKPPPSINSIPLPLTTTAMHRWCSLSTKRCV